MFTAGIAAAVPNLAVNAYGAVAAVSVGRG